jgi:PAS domain S-box-containing protein
MNQRLRILHLEDEPDYCQLVRDLLARDGIDAEMVLATTRAEFDAALARDEFDIILADYSLPSFTGIQALEIARARTHETPFLLVSGTIGEQAAVEGMRAGATDYVLKQTPERLVPAVRRAVEEARERVRRRHAETELIRREKYFRALSDNSLDIVTLLNSEGVFQFNSPSVKRVLGYEPAELLGKSAFAVCHPDDVASVIRAFQHGLKHPEETVTLEFRFRHRDGSWVYLEATGQNRLADPDIAAVVINSRDITARKRTEQDLRESEQRFRDLFEDSPDATFVEDTDGNVLDANQAACRLHGVSREELVGMNVLDLVPEEERREAVRDFRRLADGEITRVEGESLAVDGRVTPVEIHSTQIQYQGRSAVLLHVRDISERKHTEAALRSSEMLFRSVWENSVDGMRLTDEQGYIVAVNEAFCKLVGLSRAELEGKPFTVAYADDEQPECILKKYRERFLARAFRRQGERRLSLRNGNVVLLEHSNSFVELRGQPTMLLGLFRDVTAQKRLEEQLRQSQKMEAIGQLAGGVAHDFNNMLTVIHGHASLLLSGGTLTGPAGKSAQQIVQAADRAAGLTRQLLTFSRRQIMQPRRLDLNEVVGNMTSMLSRMLGEDVALEMGYWPSPALVRADAGMLEQVLLNLAVNARDAMPRGGQLHIRISVTDIEKLSTAQHVDARPGRFVCLTATDAGCGIAPEIVNRIFEPFFTTKEVGKGTGLGLATVYGIVRQHEGWIEVESELGHGTTFRVYFPAAGDGAEQREEKPAEVAVRGGTETILVVEDEQLVRELVCNLLRGYGYRILEAASGDRALDVWREHKDKIALLVTDVVMPGQVNGRELAEKLWAERPDLKVILTSGYSTDVVGKDWVEGHGLNYLQKPYHPRILAVAVRDCLDAKDRAPAT